MSAALRAEWTKLRTVAATAWLPVGIAILTIAATAMIDASIHASPHADEDPTRLALVGVDLGQVLAAMLGVLAISEEFGTGMIRTSLAAVPRRGGLLVAKAASVGGLVLLAATPAVAGSLLAGHLLLPGSGIGPAHGYHVLQIAPMSAGLAVQSTIKSASAPIAPWTGLGVAAAWALGTLTLATVLLQRRDACPARRPLTPLPASAANGVTPVQTGQRSETTVPPAEHKANRIARLASDAISLSRPNRSRTGGQDRAMVDVKSA